jgi:hypothetical protein
MSESLEELITDSLEEEGTYVAFAGETAGGRTGTERTCSALNGCRGGIRGSFGQIA